MLRCLTIRCVVAQRTDDGGAWYSSDRQLFWRIAGTRCALDDPLSLSSFLSEAALQQPVKSQQASEDSI
jgi:hypothetical protein